jgi:hypothetical protein
MDTVMFQLKFSTLLLVSFLLPISAVAERVICPASLEWKFSGYCAKKAAHGEAHCPAPSAMSKPSVLGPTMCISSGKCLGGGKPNAVGICTEVVAKEQKTYRFTKINYL